MTNPTLAEIKKQEDIRRSTDILAKLLAVENLTIIDGGCDTSYIDVANRIVHIVKFKANSPLANKMVRITSIAHEVGHSLFTPLSLLHNAVDKNYPNLASYINVVEDIRIERLIRNRYSGIHTTMKAGRKIMIDNGFYGKTAFANPNSLDFMNKLIIYTKVGKENSNITLSTRDECVVRFIERNAIDEASVIHVAKFLYLYCKQEEQEKEEDSSTKADGDSRTTLSNESSDNNPNNDSSDNDSSDNDSSDNDSSDNNSSDNNSSDNDSESLDNTSDDNEPANDSNSANNKGNNSINNMLKELMQQASTLTDDDIEAVEETLESMLEQTISKHVDSESVTTTCKKTSFSNNIIQVYTPTCKVRKI